MKQNYLLIDSATETIKRELSLCDEKKKKNKEFQLDLCFVCLVKVIKIELARTMETDFIFHFYKPFVQNIGLFFLCLFKFI